MNWRAFTIVSCLFYANLSMAQFRSPNELHVAAERRLKEAAGRVENFLKSGRARGVFLGDSVSVFITDISPSGQPIYRGILNADAAAGTGAATLHNSRNIGVKLEGEGMIVGVWDNGLVKGHVELENRLLSTQGDSPQEHATHVTGTLIAKGENPLATGMAPKAQALTYSFFNDEVVMTALGSSALNPLLISNHSYGTITGWTRAGSGWLWTGDLSISDDEDYRFGFYSARSQTLDEIAVASPYHSIFWAAGNDRAEPGNGTRPADCNSGTGYDCIIPDAVAKNIFTIGAVNKVTSYTGPASVVMGDYSSWGPTDDGRIKPDLVGIGTNLFSISANGENTYSIMGGTSMATPNVAGSLLLVQELHQKLHGGQPMKSASLKALAIHTAREAGPFPGPDYSHGWGLVDVEAASQFLLRLDQSSERFDENTLLHGETISYDLYPIANSKITVTIAWTDPPGNPVSPALDPLVPMLVNDLDIRLVDEQGLEHKPWILDPLNPVKQATQGDNFRDNVEKIEFSLPQSKPYKVVVSHKGQLKGGSQDFSLVISHTKVDAPATLYWVGGPGNWNDGSHWALTSGGEPLPVVPGKNDQAIFDENSFDGFDSDQIALTENTLIGRLKWLASSRGALQLNQKSLTVGKELTVSTSQNAFNNGVIRCAALDSGRVAWNVKSSQDVKMVVESGTWTWRGDSDFTELEVSGGALLMHNTNLTLKNLVIDSPTPKRIDFRNANIFIRSASNIAGEALNIRGDASTLHYASNVVSDWRNVIWNGSVIFSGSGGTLKGSCQLKKITVDNDLEIEGTNQFDTLVLRAGAQLIIAPAQTVQVANPRFEGTANAKVSLIGVGSFMQFLERKKLCFDFVNVDGVAALGDAVVNVGLTGSLNNAPYWQALKCEEMLFADFAITYACTNGVAQLENTSQGFSQGASWKVKGDGLLVVTGDSALVFLREQAAYEIELEVSRGTSVDRVKKAITLTPNPLTENEVLKNGSELVSFQAAESYLWLKDLNLIQNATSRVLATAQDEGLYTVVAFRDECSRRADYLVTAINENATGDITLYPNPASSIVNIEGITSLPEWILKDVFGREVARGAGRQIGVQQCQPGFYTALIQSEGRSVMIKLIVQY